MGEGAYQRFVAQYDLGLVIDVNWKRSNGYDEECSIYVSDQLDSKVNCKSARKSFDLFKKTISARQAKGFPCFLNWRAIAVRFV